MATIHGFPNSGGGDLIYTDIITGRTTDGDGLAFKVTGGITGGFNPWNNAAFFGDGSVTEDGRLFAANVPEPEAAFALVSALGCALAVIRRRKTGSSPVKTSRLS